ncbi:MAG: rhodanese-like domain-containing protein [Bacteroidales bacterium]|nr:rhodanese-like domain-containing protein [Bacteroidales bacterium]
MLEEANLKEKYFSPDELADLLVQKDPSIQLIDLRSKDEFDKFHLPGALNIPRPDILNSENKDFLDQDVKQNILYSNGTIEATEVWMILRQMGYQNNYILMGGLNYWAETIMNPQKPASVSPDEEIAKYQFRMGVNQALGGANTEEVSGNSSISVEKPIIKRPAKKKVHGGC